MKMRVLVSMWPKTSQFIYTVVTYCTSTNYIFVEPVPVHYFTCKKIKLFRYLYLAAKMYQ